MKDKEKAGKWNFHLHNSKLVTYARKNRKKRLVSEQVIWEMVRRKQILGYKFKRQRPVLNFIADFMCQELLLIVEIDGITHEDPQQQAYDAWRQRQLEEAGFTVLRFSSWDAVYNRSWVRAQIVAWVEDREV